MSDGLNRVILLGNLGADPELRHTPSGSAVLHLRLATNESYFDKTKDERQERTEWHNVVVWGTRAEALAKVLNKGSSLLVEGGLRTSSYEKDGVKRWRTEVHAREICFAGRAPRPIVTDDGPAPPPSAKRNGSRPIPPAEMLVDEIPF
jgi:single-strand DNA-binding protein